VYIITRGGSDGTNWYTKCNVTRKKKKKTVNENKKVNTSAKECKLAQTPRMVQLGR
jgi:hypothetical protein